MTKILEENGKPENKANYQEVTRKQKQREEKLAVYWLVSHPWSARPPTSYCRTPQEQGPQWVIDFRKLSHFSLKTKTNKSSKKKKRDSFEQLQEILSFMHSIF